MTDAALASENAAFLLRHAAPGRIGLCGGTDAISTLIRKAQAPLTGDGHRSLWSHAFLILEQRIDGHWWVVQSDLDLRYRQVRLGVQENRLERYFDAECFPNIAILDFGLGATPLRACQVAALDLLAGLGHYSLRELAGTALGLHSRRVRGRENLLARDRAMYCSALVQHCYSAAGVSIAPGVPGKHLTPEDIDQAAPAQGRHRLIRDVGISGIRLATGKAARLFKPR